MGVRANISGLAQSASPYTITTGRDDNQDGVSNDRPAGVGRNSERGAPRWDMNVRFSRGFGFGGSEDNRQAGPGGAGAGGGQLLVVAPPPDGGQGGPGGGPVAVGGGPGGANANQRFTLEFYVQGFNVLNRTNFVNFSGNLLSPFFGRPTSAAQARRVEVGMQFRF